MWVFKTFNQEHPISSHESFKFMTLIQTHQGGEVVLYKTSGISLHLWKDLLNPSMGHGVTGF